MCDGTGKWDEGRLAIIRDILKTAFVFDLRYSLQSFKQHTILLTDPNVLKSSGGQNPPYGFTYFQDKSKNSLFLLQEIFAMEIISPNVMKSFLDMGRPGGYRLQNHTAVGVRSAVRNPGTKKAPLHLTFAS